MIPYLLIVSYRGTAYAGWQRQENALTVQEVVEEALSGALALGRRVAVAGASRTDAGVHARAQAAHVLLEEPFAEGGLVHGTNDRLPEDVRVLSAARKEPGFHARFSATGKEYVYRASRAAVLSPLDSPFVVRAPRRLDAARVRAAVASLPGRHDFSAFASAGGSHTDPHRTLFSATLEEEGDELRLRLAGDGFLRGMVRALAGTLFWEVGTGRRSAEDFAALLAGAPRGAAGPTAPPHGLTLERVFYPEGNKLAVW